MDQKTAADLKVQYRTTADSSRPLEVRHQVKTQEHKQIPLPREIPAAVEAWDAGV